MKKNFIWTFADWCLRIPLLEMASERNEKMLKIENKNKTISEHIFKWFLMPKSMDCDHWLDEIDDLFLEITSYKWGRKHKRFTSDEYFDLLYSRFYLKDLYSLDYIRISKIFGKIEERYNSEYQREWNIDDFIESIGIVLKEVSELLEDGSYSKDKLSIILNKSFDL